MKQFSFLCLVLFFFAAAQAQSLGLNNDGLAPDNSAMLDVKHPNKGFLMPRVALTGTNDASTISSPATSLLVYNTATAGSGATAVTPGFYYYNGTAWAPLTPSVASSAWGLTGNASTVDGVQFIGTTDNVPLNIRVNNSKAGRIEADVNTANTFWGYQAGLSNVPDPINGYGLFNTANGFQALKSNNGGNKNTAIGFQTLQSITTGTNNTALGYQANVGGYNSTNATAIGNGAVALGSNEVRIGNGSVSSFYFGTGNNLATTSSAANMFYDNTTGQLMRSTASSGSGSGWGLTGNAGTADGTNFIGTTDNVPLNIRVNNQIAGRIETAFANTFWGYGAGSSNVPNTGNGTGIYNTANGGSALISNTSGSANTANGYAALGSNTSGKGNTANGYQALLNSTGSYNTANGYQTLQSITTGTNNTALGYHADVSTGNLTNATAIGNSAIVNASNKIRLGNSAVTVIEGQVAYTFPSDKRFKYNIKENVPGLDFITRLTPVTYYFDEKKLDEFTKTGVLNNSMMQPAVYDGEKQLHTGFLAQDVEKIATELGYTFDGIHAPANSKDHYGLAYSQFVMPLVKAVQEQQQIIDTQDKKINSQQEQINKMNQQIEQLTKAVEALSHK